MPGYAYINVFDFIKLMTNIWLWLFLTAIVPLSAHDIWQIFFLLFGGAGGLDDHFLFILYNIDLRENNLHTKFKFVGEIREGVLKLLD